MKFGFLKIESFKKGIVLSSAFNFLSKFLLFLQSIIVAYYFGTGISTDIYFYCFATLTLAAIFVNSLDSSVLIPESMRLREQKSKRASIKFLNFFIVIYFCTGSAITILLYIFPLNTFLFFSNFNTESISENLEILIFSIPLFTLMIITNLLVNILASYRFFTMPMIVNTINGIIALVFLVIFHNRFGLKSLLVGQLVAYVFNIILIIYLMKRNLNWHFRIEKISLSKKLLGNILYAQAGNVTSLMSSYIPIYLLSGFGAGVITALNYGQRTADMPNQMITNQASSVSGIKLNELYAKGDYDGVNRVFRETTNALLFILMPIAGMMYLYGYNILSILFQRGAFTSSSVELSMQFFKYFILLLPMLAINTMLARLFMAGQKIAYSFIYQIVFNAILIIFVIICIKIFGASGYPAALVLSHIINIFSCYFLIKWVFPHIKYIKSIIAFVKILILNLAIGTIVYGLKKLFINSTDMVNLIVGLSVYSVLIIFVNWHLHLSTEANQYVKKFLERIK